MANEAILNKGTELTLASTTSTAAITDGSFVECTNDNRQPTDNAGYTLGIFEFDTSAGGFSAAPTSGAQISIYEQKINSNSNDAPDISSAYPYDYLGSMPVKASDTQQYFSIMCSIHREGGKYWVLWEDGGAGTASISSAWTLRMTPCAFGT